MQIPIARPYIGPEEQAAVLEVLRGGQLSQGPKVAEFETKFAKHQGAKHGIAVNNGTTALTAALMAHGIGPGDEVIVPSFSFFATASSVLSVGARPVFADIDPKTFCLSPAAAEAAITPATKAIMPVHLYGLPAAMPSFEDICRRRGLVLLEDAAQAHGASLDGRSTGTFGTAAFSFYPTKNMTTTEGGMVLTNDDEIARQLRMIRNQGMDTRYFHEVVGYNYRMTDVAASIGCVQLGRLEGWTRARQENARYLSEHLTRVVTPHVPAGAQHVYHQYTIRVPAGVDRDAVNKRLNERGVGVRVYYPLPIHRQPVFASRPEYKDLQLPETERATREVLSLPVHPHLTQEEREYIVTEVNAAC